MKSLRNDPALKHLRRELRRNQTEAEKKIWHYVRSRKFHGLRFFRQYSVGSYILDFYCPAKRVAVELDGGQHNQNYNRQTDDIRSEYLKAQGIEVIRFWNHEILLDTTAVLNKLEAKITPPTLPLSQGEVDNPPLKIRGGEGEL